MRARTATVSLVAAAALVVVPAVSALAAAPAGHGRAAKAEAKVTAHQLEARLNGSLGKRSFVLGGKVTAVALPLDATTPGSVTLVVHGGRFKNLRGVEVTVDVASDASVSREGVKDLSAVLVGDHVVVRCRQLDLSVTRVPDVGWTLEGAATAVRVVATATDDSVAPAPVEPAPAQPPAA